MAVIILKFEEETGGAHG